MAKLIAVFLAAVVICASNAFRTHKRAQTKLHASSVPTPVEQHGSLSVKGNQIVGQHGVPVRLRGMSMFWSQWMSKYWNADVVKWLVKDWHCTLIRLAMGVEHGGYLENPATEKARVETMVDAAIAAGIYVVIDWHDHSAEKHLSQASVFFDEMANKYGGYPNVLFEVYNEPEHQQWSSTIKPYHEAIVPVIRKHTQNIVILGTRFWSQEVDVASADPVSGENLAYTIHFYASSHKQSLRDKVTRALGNGVPIFATEWGTCEATGDGALDFPETQTWLDFFKKHHISDANWAIGDKSEACAALRPGADGNGGWSLNMLTESGRFLRASMRGDDIGVTPNPTPVPTPAPTPGVCAESGDDCQSSKCCVDASLSCYQKDEYWASCKASCTPGIDPRDPIEYQSAWTCELLGGSVTDPTPRPTPLPTPKPDGATAGIWQQCGGASWTGPTACEIGLVCEFGNKWYSQCKPR